MSCQAVLMSESCKMLSFITSRPIRPQFPQILHLMAPALLRFIRLVSDSLSNNTIGRAV